ncbi:hypothetical protein ACQEU3_06520 [Spirillospora sp. CA-253888]
MSSTTPAAPPATAAAAVCGPMPRGRVHRDVDPAVPQQVLEQHERGEVADPAARLAAARDQAVQARAAVLGGDPRAQGDGRGRLLGAGDLHQQAAAARVGGGVHQAARDRGHVHQDGARRVGELVGPHLAPGLHPDPERAAPPAPHVRQRGERGARSTPRSSTPRPPARATATARCGAGRPNGPTPMISVCGRRRGAAPGPAARPVALPAPPEPAPAVMHCPPTSRAAADPADPRGSKPDRRPAGEDPGRGSGPTALRHTTVSDGPSTQTTHK